MDGVGEEGDEDEDGSGSGSDNQSEASGSKMEASRGTAKSSAAV